MQAFRRGVKRDFVGSLLARILRAGIPCAFVLGDALYGFDRRLRRMLKARERDRVSGPTLGYARGLENAPYLIT